MQALKSGDVVCGAVDYAHNRVWHGKVYRPPPPAKLTRRSRRRHRGRTRRVWLGWRALR